MVRLNNDETCFTLQQSFPLPRLCWASCFHPHRPVVLWQRCDMLASGRLMLSCQSSGPHTLFWHTRSYQRLLSTAQSVTESFQANSLPRALFVLLVSLLRRTRWHSPACLMQSANTEIPPPFCHSSPLRRFYPTSKRTQADFGLMPWV